MSKPHATLALFLLAVCGLLESRMFLMYFETLFPDDHDAHTAFQACSVGLLVSVSMLRWLKKNPLLMLFAIVMSALSVSMLAVVFGMRGWGAAIILVLIALTFTAVLRAAPRS